MSDSDKKALEDFLHSESVDVDQYEAFMHGVNVGLEGHASGKLLEGDVEESHEWLRKMYRLRVIENE